MQQELLTLMSMPHELLTLTTTPEDLLTLMSLPLELLTPMSIPQKLLTQTTTLTLHLMILIMTGSLQCHWVAICPLLKDLIMGRRLSVVLVLDLVVAEVKVTLTRK